MAARFLAPAMFALAVPLLALLTLLVGCAQAPTASLPSPGPATEALLRDDLYPGVQAPTPPEDLLALSPAMLQYAQTHLAGVAAVKDPRQALLDALYKEGELRLGYDASITRNAQQAFEARVGNCLSLTLMTAAFARHLGLPVSFQQVLVDSSYTRQGDLLMSSGHVNLVLGRHVRQAPGSWVSSGDWVVDFLPGANLRSQRSVIIEEPTVRAMYYNNRAAEALVEGQHGTSYAWARLALRADPGFLPAVNTLAALYLRDGHLRPAEAALQHVLARHADSTSALGNMALLLQRAGRADEAAPLLQRLARLQPDEPFVLFDLGRQAMNRGDYGQALELFQRELRREPDQSEVHFWAAQAQWRLGNAGQAAQHLQRAMDTSATSRSRELYSAKLARLKALQTR